VSDIERLGIAVGAPVKVSNGYVRQGLDGKPNLSLGKRGSLESVPESHAVNLAPLSAVTEKLARVSRKEGSFAAIECIVDSEPRYSEFVRSDGSAGSLFQFGVAEARGKPQTRVVIWSPTERPELRPGQSVVISNVRLKRSTNGEFEIHGDMGSVILPGEKPLPARLRIANITKGAGGTVVLAVGVDKRVKLVDVGKDWAGLEKGTVVDVSAEEESEGRFFCRNQESVKAVKEVGFPSLRDLATKLADAKEEKSLIMVEVIALSHGSAEDLRLRDGSTVKKGEVVVGDDTAEVKLVGWRDQAESLEGIQPGERLRISGVAPKLSKGGDWGLQLSAMTIVERLQARD
jgi:replication factor A1